MRRGGVVTWLALVCLWLNAVEAFYTSSGVVKLLDAKSFRDVKKDSGVWMVEFFAPWCGHCKALAPEWKKAAKALQGVVNVAAVDCDQHKDLAAQYGVQGFPTIKIFGVDKSKPTDYQGPRTAAGIVDAAMAEARKVVKARLASGKTGKTGKTKKAEPKTKPSKPSKPSKSSKASSSDVITLTDDDFDNTVYNSGDVWMVEFFAPWCGHCKALAPEWEQAASDLKGSVKLAAIDATANEAKAQEFGIKGFPTIKLLGPGATSPSDAIDYQGERTASAITAYALKAMEKLGGGLKIKELTSAEVVEDFCSGKSSCVIGVLPHIIDSGKAGREAYLKTMEDAAKLVRGKPFKFGWIQGGDQPDLEATFKLTFGYPSVVAVAYDRKRYVVQRGSFSADSIASFLEGVLHGKEATSGFDAFPKVKTVDPWNGEDAKPEVIEDDDDDDILNEILGSKGEKDEL